MMNSRFHGEGGVARGALVLAVSFVALGGCGEDLSGPRNDRSEKTMQSDPSSGQAAAKSFRWSLALRRRPRALENRVSRQINGRFAHTRNQTPNEWRFAGNPECAPSFLFIDENGERFVAGTFKGVADFDTGAGADFHEALADEDGFVTCFDRSGAYRWTTTFGAKKKTWLGGITGTNGVVYVLCGEQNAHVALLAMDAKSGQPTAGFGDGGCQTICCGQIDHAAGIQHGHGGPLCCSPVRQRSGRNRL